MVLGEVRPARDQDLPSGSRSAVWRSRRVVMEPVAVQALVAGSWRLAAAVLAGFDIVPVSPPATRTLPSPSRVAVLR
jgi:hypothetical protein